MTVRTDPALKQLLRAQNPESTGASRQAERELAKRDANRLQYRSTPRPAVSGRQHFRRQERLMAEWHAKIANNPAPAATETV